MINEARYIQSYAKIIGVKEEAAISYAQKKGTLALIIMLPVFLPQRRKEKNTRLL